MKTKLQDLKTLHLYVCTCMSYLAVVPCRKQSSMCNSLSKTRCISDFSPHKPLDGTLSHYTRRGGSQLKQGVIAHHQLHEHLKKQSGIQKKEKVFICL